jgi:hypothetical protein
MYLPIGAILMDSLLHPMEQNRLRFLDGDSKNRFPQVWQATSLPAKL